MGRHNEYQQKLRSKQVHHVIQYPHICGFIAYKAVRFLAELRTTQTKTNVLYEPLYPLAALYSEKTLPFYMHMYTVSISVVSQDIMQIM